MLTDVLIILMFDLIFMINFITLSCNDRNVFRTYKKVWMVNFGVLLYILFFFKFDCLIVKLKERATLYQVNLFGERLLCMLS